MSTTQYREQTLSEHNVTPDILPGGLDLSYDLTLKWPNTTLNTPAQDLDREETQPEPKVYLHPPPFETLHNLVLIMTDPDLMMSDDTYFGQVRHWLVTDLSTNPDGSVSIPQGGEISPYVGPAPLPNYMYPRPHRYVFILARGTGKVEITPEDLRELQKPYTAAVAGNQGTVQDLKDRWGFNAQKLIEQKKLVVEAVTFMRVGGTLKSAAAHMAMMSQAMANKVVGRARLYQVMRNLVAKKVCSSYGVLPSATVFNDKLQLDDEAKDLVKWSVQANEEGKKTNTKESVALMAGKPLLSIGVSDIDIEGDKVEAFDLTGKWEAVLLFDEADVFLEARGDGENDLKRNAMVSVLLRVLEYYDGILILTTNRMKSFDFAVQSRIHIKYEELDSDQQYEISKSFLEQLKRKNHVDDYNDLISWVKKDGKKFRFNGRQIRNVVSTAMGIALVHREAGGKLKRFHLVRVARQTKDFKLDLKSQEEIFKAKTK